MRLQIELTREITAGSSLHHAGYAFHSLNEQEPEEAQLFI